MLRRGAHCAAAPLRRAALASSRLSSSAPAAAGGRRAELAALAAALLAAAAQLQPASSAHCDAGAALAPASASAGGGEAAAGAERKTVVLGGREQTLASVGQRFAAVMIDGLALLSISALRCYFSGVFERVAREGVDLESFYYYWLTVPTICALTSSESAPGSPRSADGEASESQSSLQCDISPAAMVANVFCDVALNGQSPGKWLVGIRTARQDGEPMDVATASLLCLGRFSNLFFGVDYWLAVGGSDSIHNRMSGTYVVRC